MRKTILIGTLVAFAVVLALGTLYAHGPGYGRGYGSGGWDCPGRGMGGGMMGGGMMGPGGQHGYGPGYGQGYGYGPQYQQPQKPMKKSDAETILKNYLAYARNPNLKLGKITDKGDSFEAEIVTKDNSLVNKLLVDKRTGWLRSAY